MFLAEQILSASVQGYWLLMLETASILALMAGGAWALVRFGGSRLRRMGGERRMRVIERLVLEPRRSVYLIDVDGEMMLVGVSEGSVRLLGKIQDAKTKMPGETNQEAP